MSVATIRNKGQITIPIDIRSELKLKSGDKVSFVCNSGNVVMWPLNKHITCLKGIIKNPRKPVSIKEMKATIKSK